MTAPDPGRGALLEFFAAPEPLEPRLAAELDAAFGPRHLPRGAALVAPGESLSAVLFVERGLLRFYAVAERGEEWNKGFAQEGELTGPFVTGAPDWPSPHGIQALEATRLRVCDGTLFAALLRRERALERRIAAYVAALLERKARRLLSFQQEDAAGRYLGFLAEAPALARRLPQYHVASYLGITEVSLSRLRRRLRQSAGELPDS